MRTAIRVGLSIFAIAALFWLLQPTPSPLTRTVNEVASVDAPSPASPLPSASMSPTPAVGTTDAFKAWTKRFAETPAPDRDTMVEQGVALAAERRVFLENLIKTNPKAALEMAVPDDVRRQLPTEVQQQLEERVSGKGFYGVLVADYPAESRREITREVLLNRRRYDAYVYGRRESQTTRERENLWGIAIGSALAVHEEPIRALTFGEFAGIDPSGNCPVSGLEAKIHGTPAFGEVAGHVEKFCGAGHLAALSQRLAADGGIGGDGDNQPIAHDGWTQGPRSVLFMRVTYPDDPTEAITEAAAYSLMDASSAYFAETSYNTTWLVTDVTPLMVLPQPKAWYCENGDGFILSDAREISRLNGYDPDNYNLDIVRFPSPGSCTGYGYGGKAYVRGKGCWMLSNSTGTMIHELGHNYGVWHANFWTGLGDGIISHGSHVEYGNPYDVMGSSGSVGQFNASFKNNLDWMQDASVQTVSTSGTYRVFTFDVASLTPGQFYALKIRKDYDRNYWAEFRRKYANQWFLNGVMLNWDAWNNGVTNSGSGTHLLDTTPGTPTSSSSKEDSAVVIGRTYSDVPSGIHITPIARGDGSLPENWIDVVVNLGNFPGNNAPTNHLIADRASVATGVAVNFTAVASDPDDDALAYAWDFGDLTFGPNSPTTSKAWGTAGEYVVRCTVSDMKGGVNTRAVLITVGSPATFRASGRITLNGIPLEGARVHNSQSGTSYRGAYTDSDGYYTVPGLAAGNHTFTAIKYGYTLTASGWSNLITVGPSAANLDFVAAPLPAFGFSLLDTNMGEASLNPGVVRITRSGNTNVALEVRLNRTGSAVFTTDYTMNPAPTGSPLRVFFPAGTTNIDLTLTPVADVTSEGPELITLTMIENASYVLVPSAEVSLVLNDDEAYVKPTVGVIVNNSSGPLGDNIATESGSDPGVFLFSRGGNAANELLVQYSISGSATPDVDYTTMSGVVSIPAGQNSVTVAFNALDDAEVEINETVTVTLLAAAAYTVNGSSSNATVTILDDDPVTVIVVATDNIASENSGNSGTVVFNRIGSMAANLVVNYALSGSALNGTDFTSLSGMVTIPAGRPNVSLTISPINDTTEEGDETVVVSVLSSAAYNVGNPGDATVLLQDNEISTVNLSASDAAASEPGANTGTFLFTRTAPSSNDLTVFYRVLGEAVPDADYVALAGSVVFAAGVTSVVATVTPMDDIFTEVTERVLVSILPDPSYVIGTLAPVSVTISDNDPLAGGGAAIGFSRPASQGPESDTSAQISLRLSTNLPSNASVNYAVTGGTATGGGTDFTLASGTLVFPTNEVNRTISIPVVNDTSAETNETIVITLSNPTNAILDFLSTHTFTILDDDASGALTISTPDATANEAGLGTATFRITRSGSTAAAQTAFLQLLGSASAPADYTPLPTTVVIPAGTNSVDLIVIPVDDATDETNETVTIKLLPSPGARLGSPNLASISIVDDDNSNVLPIVRVDAIDAWAAEPGADTGTFRISRDRDTDSALTINFTVAGSAASGTDYTNLGTTITLPAGVWATNLVVWPRNDATFETNETVVLALSILAAYRVDPLAASATVRLVDDEQGVSVTGSGVSAEDGSSTGAFVISRTGSTVSNLTVFFRWAGTASTNDFAPFTTNAVIPAGTNSITRSILALNDGIPEGIESLVLTLATNAAYTVLTQSSAGITLLDVGVPSYWNQWRAAQFTPGELSQPLISGPDADPDLEGRRNLLEYAHNRPPKLADAGGEFTGSIEPVAPGQEGYVIRFTRRLPPTDLLYEVEVAGSLNAWQTGPALAVELPAINDGNGITETARFQIPPGPGVPAQRFVRLKVTLLSPP
jgi:PKD domain/Calx-beta domain/Carboxypeptidase regulatory-like domain